MLSIFQILILAIPILIIVDNDTNAFYFVRAAAIFLVGATVTMLVFFPKIYRLHWAQESSARRPGFIGPRIPGQQTTSVPSTSGIARRSNNCSMNSIKGAQVKLESTVQKSAAEDVPDETCKDDEDKEHGATSENRRDSLGPSFSLFLSEGMKSVKNLDKEESKVGGDGNVDSVETSDFPAERKKVLISMSSLRVGNF